jgi:Reverse transcriptase (RNA-dependent DNA polymerase)
MKGRSVSSFMDDVSVGTETAEQHFFELREVFTRFRDSGFNLKLEKCRFGKRCVEILGHQVTPGGIKPSAGHVEAISSLLNQEMVKNF